jgi:hypothetical protein
MQGRLLMTAANPDTGALMVQYPVLVFWQMCSLSRRPDPPGADKKRGKTQAKLKGETYRTAFIFVSHVDMPKTFVIEHIMPQNIHHSF